MPDLSNITNQWLLAAVVIVVLLIGGAGGGWIRGMRRDNREAKRDDVELTAKIREVAGETITDLRSDVEDLRGRVTALERELDRAYVIIRAAVGFAHTLLGYIALHLPDREDVPEIPALLHEYISERSMPFVRSGSSNLDREAASV